METHNPPTQVGQVLTPQQQALSPEARAALYTAASTDRQRELAAQELLEAQVVAGGLHSAAMRRRQLLADFVQAAAAGAVVGLLSALVVRWLGRARV